MTKTFAIFWGPYGRPDATPIGWAIEDDYGWKFHPNKQAVKARVSRKYWPTCEACFPKWTGGLDHTWSRKVDLTGVVDKLLAGKAGVEPATT